MSIPDVLIKGAMELGVDLSEKEAGLFKLYLEQLKLWNQKINLTAVKTDRDIVIKHFLDSLTPVKLIREKAKLLDIGSGAGFPGVPLKIVRPDLQVTLLDSSGKKVSFLKHLIRKLGLKGIHAVSFRAEDAGNGLPRGSFDCVITRAVGSIEHVLELSSPYINEGGEIILMRGRAGSGDARDSGYPSGLKLKREMSLTLPFGGQKRKLLIFKPGVG